MNNKTVQAAFIHDYPFFLSLPAFVWVLLFFYLPLGAIIVWSLVVRDPQTDAASLSLANYGTFFATPFLTIIKRSLFLALGTAASCLLFAYPTAYFLARKVKRGKGFLLFFLMLPFGVNILVQAYAWFFVLGRSGLINDTLLSLGIIKEPFNMLYTPGAVYIGMVYCYLPFMIMPIYAVLEKLDQQFIEASLDLGASWLKTMWRVVFPLSIPGISTGFLLVFIPVFGELVIPSLLGGDKQMYVGPLISFYYLTTRNLVVGSAFTCFSGIIVITVAWLIYWWLKRLRT